MTMFWWARALKGSHLEQARAMVAFCARNLSTQRDMHVAYGHMRAIYRIEDAVETAPGTMRADLARRLSLDTDQTIGKLMSIYKTFWDTTEAGHVLQVMHPDRAEEIMEPLLREFDEWEKRHEHIMGI